MTAQQQYKQARSAGEAFLGMEVSWDLGEHARSIAIPRDQFERLFVAAGADKKMFKPVPTPENSLHRACRIGWGQGLGISANEVAVKQLSRPDMDTPLAFAVLYRQGIAGEKDHWVVGARVRIEAGLAVVREPADENSFPSPSALMWAEQCASYANDRATLAFNQDVSEALVQFGRQLGWVSRRQSGGVYFLPGNLGEAFSKVLDSLTSLTADDGAFEGNSTPQYADPRTLSTWQRRTVSTFLSEVEALNAKLIDMSSRANTRVSSFDLRTAECTLLIARARNYAEVLKEKLGPLESTIASLKLAFGDEREKFALAKRRCEDAFDVVQNMADEACKKSAVAKARPRSKPLSARVEDLDAEALDTLFGTA